MQSTGKVINFNQMRQTSRNTSEGKKPKILFVDDEERILNTMQALFRRRYDTTTTTDGYQALELLKQDHYQLLVSDQRMPIMAGVDLLREAKKVSPDTIRILLTGYSDLTAIIGSVNEGEVFRFLNKPWDTQEFIKTVDEAVKIGEELQQAANDAPAKPVIVENSNTPLTNSEPVASTSDKKTEAINYPAERVNADSNNIIVLRGDPQMLGAIGKMMPECRILPADSYETAIDLMLEHEIGVIVSNIENDHEDALEFFTLLKNEHPQVVSILLANSGDSTTLIHLINHARVFRYMFKPIRERLMGRFLHSAIEQYHKFKVAPTQLKQQQAQKPSPVPEEAIPEAKLIVREDAGQTQPAAAVAQNKPKLLGKMRKIRSFFSRLVSK